MGENMVLKHSVILEPGMTRRDALKAGALATATGIASAIFGKYLLEGEARADKKNGNGNGNGNGHTYKTVKLSKVQEWDKAAQKYREDCGGQDYCQVDTRYSSKVSMQFQGVLIAGVLMIFQDDEKRNESTLDLNARRNGTLKQLTVPLSRLMKIYPDLKYARLVIEEDKDEKGPFVQIWAVPVDNPKATIKSGVPIVGAGYGDGGVWQTEVNIIRRS